MPYEQFPLPFTNIMVRGSAPETVVWPLVRAQITSIDPQLPPGDLSSMQNVINRSVAEPRFRSLMLGAFALMALILAAVGLYGLISYSVTQRTREIGIRVALGAELREVLTLMLREGACSLVGIAAGLVGALIAARALSRFLFGVGAGDPMTFALVSITLLLVATIASYLPARRAPRRESGHGASRRVDASRILSAVRTTSTISGTSRTRTMCAVEDGGRHGSRRPSARRQACPRPPRAGRTCATRRPGSGDRGRPAVSGPRALRKCARALREAETRIDDDPLARHPRCHRRLDPSGQLARDLLITSP